MSKRKYPEITHVTVDAPVRELDPEKTAKVVLPTKEQVAEAVREALRSPGKVVVVG